MVCMNKAVIVLGQGRSGTSLITSLLASLGVFVENTVPADEYNKKGYWESEQMVQINDEILCKFGEPWPNFYSMPPAWEMSEAVQPFVDRSRALIESMS